MFKGGYKQKIKTLSENNKALVEALENYRYQCSEKEKTLIQVSTAALQNSISAKAKLNKLAKDLKEFLCSIEELISLMNTNSSAYPTMFIPNIKPKRSRDCLSKLIESISEETLSNMDDFSISKPHSRLGENKKLMENGNTKSSPSSIPTKRLTKAEKIKHKKIPVIQKQSKEKVLKTPSEYLLRKQDLSSDIEKPLPPNKRCRNSSEVQLHQEYARKKQKPNPLGESEKTIKKNKHLTVNSNPEHSVDKRLLDPIMCVINTDQPQANLQDVTVGDKHHEDIALQKTKVIPKKSTRAKYQRKKNSDEKPSLVTTSKRTKILARPLKPLVNKVNISEATNIKVTSFDEEKKCFEKSNVLQETIGSREQLPNKLILCSVENIPCDEAVKTTVTAEIHKPPSDKLEEKKTYSSNLAFKIMQPCVVLTDIRETSLLIESDGGDFFVEAPSLKVQNEECIKKKTKLKLTEEKNSKARGSAPSHPKSSRSCRSRPAISYKENSLNTKMRRS